MARILLVEDDRTFSQMLKAFLENFNHTVTAKYEVKAGLSALSQQSFDLLLLDYRLEDGTGIEVMEEARKLGLQAPVIIMTSFNDVRTAVKAIRSGAFDYITKPVNPDELLLVINEALNKPSGEPGRAEQAVGYVEGESRASSRIKEMISLVAPTDISVLIQGASGTGKEYVARSIHHLSSRSGQPFVSIDCGTLSKELAASELFGHKRGAFTGALQDKKGKFELADQGTLFLDEVGNLGYEVQIQLLRVLQERVIQPVGGQQAVQVNVRIIAATNDDLMNSVSKGIFREDLYHRLNEFKILVPALKDREMDIDIFIQHFINEANRDLKRQVKSFSAEAMQVLHSYDWPGNLRELRNVIRRMVLLAKDETPGIEVLPEEMIASIQQASDYGDGSLKAMNEMNEKELILKTLEEVRYNKSKAARLLNIDRKTLYLKMAKYGIE